MKAIMLTLVFVVAIVSTAAGLAMIASPDGNMLNLSPDFLKSTPFKDFAVPGLILATAVGGVNLMALYYYIDKNRRVYLNVSVAGSIALVSWILIALLFVPINNWLLFISLGIGILIILIALQLKGKWIV